MVGHALRFSGVSNGIGQSHMPHLALSWLLPLMALLDPARAPHIVSVKGFKDCYCYCYARICLVIVRLGFKCTLGLLSNHLP